MTGLRRGIGSTISACWRVCRCQKGATSIEYALVASLISMAILAGATLIGQRLTTTFDTVASNLK